MDFANNFTIDISEQLGINHVEDAYRSTNQVNYSRQILMHNTWSTSVDCMEQILSYPALQDFYDISLPNDFNIISPADKW